MNIFTLEWWKAATVRAIKTFAQAVLSVVTLGMAASEVDWRYAVSVGVVAIVYSYLTSLAGLPETNKPEGQAQP